MLCKYVGAMFEKSCDTKNGRVPIFHKTAKPDDNGQVSPE